MTNLIAIHGLGYVGLTAALHWARAGWTVIGYDPDPNTIERLRAGAPRAGEFLSYANTDIALLVVGGLIVPTSRFEDTLECSVHSIAVPTEKNGEPYDDIVIQLLEKLLVETPLDTTILVESTLTPGTIDRVLDSEVCAIEDAEEPGVIGRYLAVCPRRDWFASAEKSLESLTRIVGGVTPACTARASALLSTVSRDIRTTDYRTAELTKALENALLHAMVMLPTELAINAPHLNVAEALTLATTHWRLPSLYLGAGAGGRCVPLGSKYLKGLVPGSGGMLDAALATDRLIRSNVAESVVRRGAKSVLVLGMAYRPGFRDAGSSPGIDIAQRLSRQYGVRTAVADPMWSREELKEMTGLEVVERPRTEVKSFDAVILVTPHEEYTDPTGGWEFWAGQEVLDAQGAWAKYKQFFLDLDVNYFQLGMSGWMSG